MVTAAMARATREAKPGRRDFSYFRPARGGRSLQRGEEVLRRVCLVHGPIMVHESLLRLTESAFGATRIA